jgi:hypothetical protein
VHGRRQPAPRRSRVRRRRARQLVSGAPRRLRRADGWPYGTRLPLSDRMQASRNAPRGLSLGTSRERLDPASSRFRNRRRKQVRPDPAPGLPRVVRTERPTPELGDVHLNGRKQPCAAGARHVRRRGRWWATDDGFGLGGEHEASEHGGRRDSRAVLAASCETPAPCRTSLITSAPRSAVPSLGRLHPGDDVRGRRLVS